MNYLIQAPANRSVRTVLKLPASKSISNRILILNALGNSPYTVRNLSDSDDTAVMRNALHSNRSAFDIGAAGTAMRFLTAFLSQIEGEWTLTGTERMKNRPVKLLVEALNALGARIEYIEKEGYPPLHIFGSTLRGGEMTLSGEISSQYISALLMIAPCMEKGLILHLEGTVVSAPYIHLTVQLMRQFGAEVEWTGQTIRTLPGAYRPQPFTVEADWSAASYWYAVAALSEQAEIGLSGLQAHSLQGDAAGAALFARLGVETAFTAEGAVLRRTGHICEHLTYHFVNEPDLAQTFVTACLGLEVPFRFTGLQSLKIKETDRIEALKTECRKLGYLLADSQGSVLEWKGGKCLPEPNPVIRTYEDHRMAMAFAPLVLIRRQGLEISRPGVVTKSYPAFWEHLKAAGFGITPHPQQQ
ncbi:MAG: 3-phosphoshikimate 1-carboxyvinyltransferase [Tannerellaceae bacterium]|jgi:3-phosphoshikimate 1-carboxyvinyltransferase|nr:3-phosphoshikimate 1-carboxyvinyltransferase [Tannerellaceae bacterium]